MNEGGGLFSAPRRATWVRAWRAGLPAPASVLLGPAAGAYRVGLAIRDAVYTIGVRRTGRLPCLVVSVGNLTVGGTGKTPTVELIAKSLAATGRRVVILSRGYGGRGGPGVRLVSDGVRLLRRVDEVGDEPILLARRLPGVPIVVGRDRLVAGEWALARLSPEVLLLDDGLQQRRLHVDVHVVCLDARAPFGPGGLVPRGTLREPPDALGRADFVVLTHASPSGELAALVARVLGLAPTALLVTAAYVVEGIEEIGTGRREALGVLRGRTVLAFAGIGVPEGLERTLGAHGIVPRAFVAFPDHHPYSARDLGGLERRARALGADCLVTTEKDAVRLAPAGSVPIWALRVRLSLGEGQANWTAALGARLAGTTLAAGDRA